MIRKRPSRDPVIISEMIPMLSSPYIPGEGGLW